MQFIDAIKQGIAKAEDYQRNKAEIMEVFEEVNQAIFEKTGAKNGFVTITDNSIYLNEIIKQINFSRCGYPVTIHFINENHESHDKTELEENICKIISTSDFGFYIKKLQAKKD